MRNRSLPPLVRLLDGAACNVPGLRNRSLPPFARLGLSAGWPCFTSAAPRSLIRPSRRSPLPSANATWTGKREGESPPRWPLALCRTSVLLGDSLKTGNFLGVGEACRQKRVVFGNYCQVGEARAKEMIVFEARKALFGSKIELVVPNLVVRERSFSVFTQCMPCGFLLPLLFSEKALVSRFALLLPLKNSGKAKAEDEKTPKRAAGH